MPLYTLMNACYDELFTSWMSMGDDPFSCCSNSLLPAGKNFDSDGVDMSFMLPLARSIRNSAGFIAMRGEKPMEEK